MKGRKRGGKPEELGVNQIGDGVDGVGGTHVADNGLLQFLGGLEAHKETVCLGDVGDVLADGGTKETLVTNGNGQLIYCLS